MAERIFLPFLALIRRLVVALALEALRTVLLIDPVPRVAVRIAIALAVTEILRASVRRVAEMDRDGLGRGIPAAP